MSGRESGGLSSAEAVERLQTDLHQLLQEHYKAEPLYRTIVDSLRHRTTNDSLVHYCPVYILLTLLSATVLLVCALYTNSTVSIYTVTSALLLYVLCAVNIWITVRTYTLRRTEQWRRLELLCEELQSVRDQLTAYGKVICAPVIQPVSEAIDLQWVLRDGCLVNLPWLLIVRGDVLHLRPGRTVPVRCRSLSPTTCSPSDGSWVEPCTFTAGQLYSPHPKSDPSTGGVVPLAPLACLSLETFAVKHVNLIFETTEHSPQRPSTLFSRELDKCAHVLWEYLVLPVTILLTVAVNIWVYCMSDSQIYVQSTLINSVIGIVPILGLPVPIMLLLCTMWHLAALLTIVEVIRSFSVGRTRENTSSTTERKEKSDSHNVSRSELGSEPEEHDVPLLHSNAQLVNQQSVTSIWSTFSALLNGEPAHLPYTCNLLYGLGNVSSFSVVDRKGLLAWPNPTPEKVFILAEADPILEGNEPVESDSNPNTLEGAAGNEHTQRTRADTFRSATTGPPAQAVVLDLSSAAPRDIRFDDCHWQQFHNHLRPIAVNIELNCCQMDEFYIQLHDHLSVVSETVPRTIATVNRRCCCPLSVLLGMRTAGRGHGPHDLTQVQTTGVYRRQPGQAPVPGLTKHRTPLANMLAGTFFCSWHTCSSHFWNGERVCDLSRVIRKQILDFYHRNSLTSYCLAFAYRPISARLSGSVGGVYVDWPLDRRARRAVHQHHQHRHNHWTLPGHNLIQALSVDSVLHDEFNAAANQHSELHMSARDCIDKVLSDQIFLGMVTLQYQARANVVQLVESLDKACIRFVHFSKENELRSRIFAEKLGIEAGWNCHISLAAEGSLDWTQRLVRYTRDATFNSRRFVSTAQHAKSRRVSVHESSTAQLLNAQKRVRDGKSSSTALQQQTASQNLVVAESEQCLLTTGRERLASIAVAEDDVSFDDELLLPDTSFGSKSNMDLSISEQAVAAAIVERVEPNCEHSNHSSSQSSLISDSSASTKQVPSSDVPLPTSAVPPNKARLPVGIAAVRPHLRDVDNVPLLVNLFTDCDAQSNCEMIRIMQEYGEVVAVLGSSLNSHNALVFAQADVSVCIEPAAPQACLMEPVPSKSSSAIPCASVLASAIMSASCVLNLRADQEGHMQLLLVLIGQARHRLEALRTALLFMAMAQLMLWCTHMLCAVVLLPPALHASQTVLLALCHIPLLAMSLSMSPCHLRQALHMGTVKNTDCVTAKHCRYWAKGVLLKCVPSILILTATYVCLILIYCGQTTDNYSILPSTVTQMNSTVMTPYDWCELTNQHAALDLFSNATGIFQRSTNNQSEKSLEVAVPFDDWLFMCQTLMGLLYTVYLCVISGAFVCKHKQLWQFCPLRNLVWTSVCIALVSVQCVIVVYNCTLGQSLSHSEVSSPISWAQIEIVLVSLFLCLPVVAVNELCKRSEIKLYSRDQRRQKLNFGTKLGMNSPI